MKQLIQKQLLPISLDEAWEFFATPKNLNEVTPPDLVFKILSDVPDKMYEGLMISYKIQPMLNISLSWHTEITHIKEKQFFVDEQRLGPYNIWHHEHHFEAVEGGVMMTDLIHYKAPLGFLGDIAVALFIKRQLEGIFAFRKKKVEELFG